MSRKVNSKFSVGAHVCAYVYACEEMYVCICMCMFMGTVCVHVHMCAHTQVLCYLRIK